MSKSKNGDITLTAKQAVFLAFTTGLGIGLGAFGIYNILKDQQKSKGNSNNDMDGNYYRRLTQVTSPRFGFTDEITNDEEDISVANVWIYLCKIIIYMCLN